MAYDARGCQVQGLLKRSVDSNLQRTNLSIGDAVPQSKKDAQRPKCACREKGPCTAPPLPDKPSKFGRGAPLRIATFLFDCENKGELFTGPGIDVFELNAQESLVEQWKSLVTSQTTPELIVTKITKAICNRNDDENAAIAYNNYLELRNELSPDIEGKEVAPLEAQFTLSDRKQMEAAINVVCGAVNDSLGLNPPKRTSDSIPSAATLASRPPTPSSQVSAADVDSVTIDAPEKRPSHYPCVGPACFVIEKAKEEEEEGDEEKERLDGEGDEGGTNGGGKDQTDGEETDFISDTALIANVFESLPFPLVAKAIHTSTKTMALLFDAAGLAHFRESLNCDLMVQEYVPHGNVIIKLYNVGERVFIVERPSLPDVGPEMPPNSAGLEAIRRDINGEIVRVAASLPEEGETDAVPCYYVTFDSATLTKRRPLIRAGELTEDQFQHLDRVVLRHIAKGFRNLLRLPLFGVDVLVSAATLYHHVIDVNLIPGFKGIDKPEVPIAKYLVNEAKRRAFEADCRSLKPVDVLDIARLYNDEWRRRHVTPQQLKARHLTMNRLFEVSIRDDTTRKDVSCRHALIQIADNGGLSDGDFSSEMRRVSEELALMPGGSRTLQTFYFDGETVDVGSVRPWIKVKPLQIILTKKSEKHPSQLWSLLGASIAKQHGLAVDESFTSAILDRFWSDRTTPLKNGIAEAVMAKALLLVNTSDKRKSAAWKTALFDKVSSAVHAFSSRKESIIAGLKIPSVSSKIIFGNAAPDILAKIFVLTALREEPEAAAPTTNAEVSPEDDGQRQTAAPTEQPSPADAEQGAIAIGDEKASSSPSPPSSRSVAEDMRIIFDADERSRSRGILGPNYAVVDIANVLVGLSVMSVRRMTNFDEDDNDVNSLREVAVKIAEGYLVHSTGMTAPDKDGDAKANRAINLNREEGVANASGDDVVIPDPEAQSEHERVTFEADVQSLAADGWSFVPLVALMHACQSLLRASAEGQFNNEPRPRDDDDDVESEDFGIIRRRDRKFNWLRHALDHMTVYEEALKETEGSDGKGAESGGEERHSPEKPTRESSNQL